MKLVKPSLVGIFFFLLCSVHMAFAEIKVIAAYSNGSDRYVAEIFNSDGAGLFSGKYYLWIDGTVAHRVNQKSFDPEKKTLVYQESIEGALGALTFNRDHTLLVQSKNQSLLLNTCDSECIAVLKQRLIDGSIQIARVPVLFQKKNLFRIEESDTHFFIDVEQARPYIENYRIFEIENGRATRLKGIVTATSHDVIISLEDGRRIVYANSKELSTAPLTRNVLISAQNRNNRVILQKLDLSTFDPFLGGVSDYAPLVSPSNVFSGCDERLTKK